MRSFCVNETNMRYRHKVGKGKHEVEKVFKAALFKI